MAEGFYVQALVGALLKGIKTFVGFLRRNGEC